MVTITVWVPLYYLLNAAATISLVENNVATIKVC